MLVKFTRVSLEVPDVFVPARASDGAGCYDVRAYHQIDKISRKEIPGGLPCVIPPAEARLFGIGVQMEVPTGYIVDVRPRSGLANKYDVELSNSPGTVDADYRGEVSVLLRNRGTSPFTVEPEMRIAQIGFVRIEVPEFAEVEELSPSARDSGGFGSTGFFSITEGVAASRCEQRTRDLYWLNVAEAIAQRSNCLRGANRNADGSYIKDERGRYVGAVRRIGALLVIGDSIVATGANTRTKDCNEKDGCIRERLKIPSGTQLEQGCDHAESLCFMSRVSNGGPSLRGKKATLYITTKPCLMCTARIIIPSGVPRVVVPAASDYPTDAVKRLIDEGIEFCQV